MAKMNEIKMQKSHIYTQPFSLYKKGCNINLNQKRIRTNNYLIFQKLIFIFIINMIIPKINTSSISYIIIKINQSGHHRMFYKDHIPLKVYINSNESDNSINEYDFTSEENIVELHFESTKEDYNSLFYDCTAINEINFTNFFASDIAKMNSMFKGCTSLTSINFGDIDTSHVIDMAFLFYNCSSLNYLDLSNFNTQNVRDMNWMFGEMHSLTSLDLSNFDTSNVEDMSYMFYGLKNIIYLNLGSFDTSKVNYMNFMFRDCIILSSLNLENFDTSNVVNMDHMFLGCFSITSINISNFDASKVTNMCGMFAHCYKVKSIILPTLHNSQLLDTNYMFHMCGSLESLDFSKFDTSLVTKMDGMFEGCSNLTSINFNNFNTSKVTDMTNMFNQCKKLKALDLSSFDTSLVKNMNYMFNGCLELGSLNVASFSTSKVKSFIGMFTGCSSISSLDLSNFDTSSAQNMNFMFSDCKNLTSLDLSNFNTLNTVNMEHMFLGCSSLTSINLTNFDSSKVTDMCGMFAHCYKVKSIILPTLHNSQLLDTNYMFHMCGSLESLDFSKFDTSLVTKMDGMFEGCSSLTSINFNNFNTSNVIYMNNMFNGAGLISLDLSSFDTSNTEDISYMFAGISNIASLDLSFFDTSKVKYMSQLFYLSHNLKYLDLKNFIIPENISIDNFIDSNLINPIICIDDIQSFYKIISLLKCYDEYCNITEKENISCINGCPLIKYDSRCYQICSYYYYFDFEINKYTCTPELKCPKNYNKLILETKECINSTENSENLFNNSLPLCPKENPFLNIELLKCVYNCTIKERQNKICITNYVSSNQEDDYDIFDIIINQTRNELTNNFDESVINGIPIKEKEIKIILTKTDNQGNDTILNLSLCEERLKYTYNITKNESLYLLRIDTEQDGMKTSSFNYELYFPNNSNNLEQLNLSICKDIKIDIIIQINLTENLDKYNLKSGYYNDICYTADSDYGTDIILSDRKEEYFNNNYSICEINCDFVSYNYETNKAVCSCGIKTEIPFMKNIKIDKNLLKKSFTEIINIINYKIIFCYKTVFKKNR